MGHADVEEHQIGAFAGDDIDGQAGILDQLYVGVACNLEDLLGELQSGLIIVNDGDFRVGEVPSIRLSHLLARPSLDVPGESFRPDLDSTASRARGGRKIR